MRLVFSQPHLSIEQFEPIVLPEFAVLTGVNGSGKSHLLQAIEAGKIQVEGLARSSIVRFNYETFKLENEALFSAQQIAQEKESAWQLWTQQIQGNVSSWRGTINEGYDELIGRAKSDKKPLWEMDGHAGLDVYRNNADVFFRNPQFLNDQRAQAIFSLVKSSPKAVDDLEHDDFFATYRPYAFKADFLPMQLGRVFWDYYEKYQRNRFNRWQNEQDGLSLRAVSDEEFLSTYGEKPWRVVSEILRSFDSLDYDVISPEGLDLFGSYQVKLRSKSNPQLVVDFSSLSSGEQVLLALVAAVYKVSSDNHFPGLLLLDEIDASLHPSMMKNLLYVVQEIFLKRKVAVILVTHSPTTVAFAPEESVCLMQRRGTHPRLSKATRGEALSVLTEGFATLEEGIKIFDEISQSAISVFTEGNNVEYLKLYLEILGMTGVEVISGLESMSGKNQLKTLFDFFSKVPHSNKVLFVWDCDVRYNVIEVNNTFAFFLPRNTSNTICSSGIENALPVGCFDTFVKTTKLANGTELTQFDGGCKAALAKHIVARRNVTDFSHFESLADKLKEISGC